MNTQDTLAPAPPLTHPMQSHVTILAALYIGFSILGLLGAFFVFSGLALGGALSGDLAAFGATAGIGAFIAGFILLISVPGLIGGIGLLKRREWARILVLVLGFINLINIPFGTILGAYSIWVLIKPETADLFSRPTPPVPA